MDGDVLTLLVRYEGGCEAHGFTLLVLGEVLGLQNFLSSILSHDARSDSCETQIQETLRFDLKPLKPLVLRSRHFGPSPDGVDLVVRGVRGSCFIKGNVTGDLKEGCGARGR